MSEQEASTYIQKRGSLNNKKVGKRSHQYGKGNSTSFYRCLRKGLREKIHGKNDFLADAERTVSLSSYRLRGGKKEKATQLCPTNCKVATEKELNFNRALLGGEKRKTTPYYS